MAKVSAIPQSQQGGGSSVNEAEVLEFVTIFKGNPALEVVADDNPAFHKAGDEPTGKDARKRAVSAAGRMRAKVAAMLELEEVEVRTAARMVEGTEKNPKVYAYWLKLTATGQEQVAARFPVEADAEVEAPEVEADTEAA